MQATNKNLLTGRNQKCTEQKDKKAVSPWQQEQNGDGEQHGHYHDGVKNRVGSAAAKSPVLKIQFNTPVDKRNRSRGIETNMLGTVVAPRGRYGHRDGLRKPR